MPDDRPGTELGDLLGRYTPATMATELARSLKARRKADRLPATAPLVRGGLMDLDDLLKAARACQAQHGRPGLSVIAAEDLDVPGLIRTSNLVYTSIRVARAGDVRGLGSTIEQTGTPPHHTIWLPGKDRLPEELKALVQTFDEPITVRKALGLEGYSSL